MKETEFIKQNENKWREFEEILNSPKGDPEQMGRVFIETTDDLSYARTRFKNRSVRVYLNGIAQKIHQNIYKNHQKDRSNLSFWKQKVPIYLWDSRKELLVSFLVFITSIGIGLLSSHYNPNFPEIILGQDYIEMTNANIESGNPMAVYDQSSPLEMFLAIAWNNIRVSFLVFVLGAFFSIGTLLALLRNGIMVGAFVSFFIARDLFRESILAIMLHGTLELSCIVIAGAAGLTMGKGLVFPGTYTRLQSFLLSARKGISMMIVITPLLLIAAFIEGFATRHTDLHDGIRLAVILLSLAVMIAYFVYLPYRVFHTKSTKIGEEEVSIRTISKPVYEEIKSSGKIFTESFYFLQKNFKAILSLAFFGAIVLNIALGALNNWDYASIIQADYFLNSDFYAAQLANLFWFPDDVSAFFNFSKYPVLFLISTFILGRLLHISIKSIIDEKDFPKTLSNQLVIYLVASLSLLPFFINNNLILLLSLSISVVVIFYGIYFIKHKEDNSWSRFRPVLSSKFFGLVGLILMMALFQFVCMFLINAPLSYFIFDFILINIQNDWEIAQQIPFILYGLLTVFSIVVLSFLSLISIGLFLGSSLEITEATELKLMLQNFGQKKRYDGIERED